MISRAVQRFEDANTEKPELDVTVSQIQLRPYIGIELASSNLDESNWHVSLNGG